MPVKGLPGRDASLRPQRLLVRDFAGRKFSFGTEKTCWRFLGGNSRGKRALVLGLGPKTPVPFQDYAEVYWHDCPQILEQTSMQAPPGWIFTEAAVLEDVAKNAAVYFYAPGLRAAPEYWGALIGKIRTSLYPPLRRPIKRSLWLPGHAGQLLHADLAHAFNAEGFECIYSAVPESCSQLPALWHGNAPSIALSVNFRGLDGNGEVFEYCRAAGVPLAIWIVDNPWNLLSGVTLPWWKEASLFLTDKSHIEPLRKAGAKHVYFLPLAAPWHMKPGEGSVQSRTPLFVGRSEFPEKKAFFAGSRIEPALMEQALEMLRKGLKPDFHWWVKQCGLGLWPGHQGRKAALGAEECSRLRRAQWLRQAAAGALEIIGDSGWAELLPHARILPLVDYYRGLAGCYAKAECVLNVTSLLLPGSLNQRHFDVWAAGGFLLSDATPGLDLFPRSLTEPVVLTEPSEFAGRLEYFRYSPGEKAGLAAAWREEIALRHRYQNRIGKIMEILEGA